MFGFGFLGRENYERCDKGLPKFDKLRLHIDKIRTVLMVKTRIVLRF
jgi:hypothetical protein